MSSTSYKIIQPSKIFQSLSHFNKIIWLTLNIKCTYPNAILIFCITSVKSFAYKNIVSIIFLTSMIFVHDFIESNKCKTLSVFFQQTTRSIAYTWVSFIIKNEGKNICLFFFLCFCFYCAANGQKFYAAVHKMITFWIELH